jgi:tripartite-type tricarboxylate transporter receptor subunit TctC
MRPMKLYFVLLAFMVLVFNLSSAAWAQSFPTKSLKIVVPNTAGGAADITARTVGQKLGEALGQTVVIENKPSAGGIVAGEQVAKADPDGHSLLLISSGTAVSAALFKQLPFDTLRDFAPVSKLASFDLVITALRGGEIDAMVDILGPLMAQVGSKTLRPVAILGEKRSVALPDVPTVRESGGTLASFNVTSWNGLAVPAKTPKDVVAKLNREIQTVLAQPEVKKRLSDLTLNAQGSTPE